MINKEWQLQEQRKLQADAVGAGLFSRIGRRTLNLIRQGRNVQSKAALPYMWQMKSSLFIENINLFQLLFIAPGEKRGIVGAQFLEQSFAGFE